MRYDLHSKNQGVYTLIVEGYIIVRTFKGRVLRGKYIREGTYVYIFDYEKPFDDYFVLPGSWVIA